MEYDMIVIQRGKGFITKEPFYKVTRISDRAYVAGFKIGEYVRRDELDRRLSQRTLSVRII